MIAGTHVLFRVLTLPFRLIRRFATFAAILALLASLAFNVAVLTVSGVYVAASGAFSALGVSTVAAREAAERSAQRRAARNVATEISRKVTRRVQQGAARNISSVAGEAIPLVGVAVIAGALALELRDACDTARDMAGLEAALLTEDDPDVARTVAIEAFDCGAMIREELPDYEDLPSKEDIWKAAREAPGNAYESARRAGIGIAEVNWSGKAGAAVDWLLGLASELADWFAPEHVPAP